MSYRALMWMLAAAALVAVITAFDLYRERREDGPVFIASTAPITEEQVRQKMNADGWTNALSTREGRYFQVIGSKLQQTSISPLMRGTGRQRGGEDDDWDSWAA